MMPGFLGRVLGSGSVPVGTCFQIAPGVVVTAWSVLDAAGAGDEGAAVALDLPAEGWTTDGRTVRVDPLRDLAVIRVDRPFPVSVAGFAATDGVEGATAVLVTGVAEVDDERSGPRPLDAPGAWEGGTTREDRVALGRVRAATVVAGMCGAPVRRRADGLVVGVLSGRYNGADGWPASSVWVARVEDLLPLLDGLATAFAHDGWAGDGAVAVTLTVDDARVRLRAPGIDVDRPHPGVSPMLARQVNQLWQTRARLGAAHQGAARDARPATPPPVTGAVGQLLAEAFLPAPMDARLAEVLQRAGTRHTAVRLGVRVAGELARLPWEMLRLPGTGRPLALHELTRAYRQVDAPPVALSAGPLRILVGISSPLSGGGGVLDYERELRNVLAAVRGARASRAQVRIVHFATTAGIREALQEASAHILHLSGHGSPGMVELEDEDGDARLVTAERFVAEAIPPGRMPPVIALAACHTDVATAAGDPSFAAALIARGAGVVIATETSISDVYATRVFARVYGQLAAERDADVVAAVAEARVVVQRELLASHDERDQRLAALDEWSVLTVLSGAGRVPLVDWTMPAVPAVPGTAPVGVLRRDVGEVVGRRREQRCWPVELLARGAAGIVVHGIGGAGKTTLADELCARVLERDPDRVMVTVIGQTSGGQLLDTITTTLARHLAATMPEAGPHDPVWWGLRQAGDGELPWPERVAALGAQVLGAVPVLLVLDNFEDNLTDAAAGRPAVRDEALAGVLARLAVFPGRCRLLVTSRYAFTLPDAAERALSFRPLGPLSFAETQKLAWALPRLDRLDEAELEQVWRAVGGHPRCLEYVDALLGGAGRGRFPDVTLRLAGAVRRRLRDHPGIVDVDAYFTQHVKLDAALAEVATLAADDVLLDGLLDGLEVLPGAHRLLLGASVYRRPVDRDALHFQVGEPGTPELLAACVAASLITHDAGGSTTYVHRWTAAELARWWTISNRADELIDAHRRAADYWQWRARTVPQPATADLDDLREAHHHYTAAAELGHGDSMLDLSRVAGDLQNRLGGLGLRHEALTFAIQAVEIRRAFAHADPDRHLPSLAVSLNNLAVRLGGTGDHVEGLSVDEEALAIYRRLARTDPETFEPGLAMVLNNLGIALSRLGRLEEALTPAEEAITIYRRLAGVDPGAVEPDLALALNSLGSRLSSLGRWEEALTVTGEAVASYRRLARTSPDAFEPDLVLALNNLSLDLAQLGRRQDALSAGAEAVAVCRRLVLDNPGWSEPDLAMVLNNLGARLSDLGRWEEALTATEEAVTLRRKLVQETPGAFEANLVSALNNLSVDLSNLGRWAEALPVTEEAVAVCRRLVLANPGGFEPELAGALDTLGNRLSAVERWEASLAATAEAVAIRRRLARATPGAFDADLAGALHNLGVRLANLGRLEEALLAAGEAVETYRRLALLTPDAFEPDLAVALNSMGDYLADLGRPRESSAATSEAVAINRRLALADPGGFETDPG
jgi:tetratricopeptide (TPR) repeat protein